MAVLPVPKCLNNTSPIKEPIEGPVRSSSHGPMKFNLPGPLFRGKTVIHSIDKKKKKSKHHSQKRFLCE